jgi:hypothetical protein
MSFLGPRATRLDAPPPAPQGLGGSAAGPCAAAAPVPPPKPPSLRPAIHRMVGDTPWFEAGGKGTHFGGAPAPAKSGEEHWSEEEEELKKEEEQISRPAAAAPEPLKQQQAPAPAPAPMSAPAAQQPAAPLAAASHTPVAQADKSTQTDVSGDSSRLAELEAAVGRLEAEKRVWLQRIHKAKAKRAQAAKQSEPNPKLRPFVSTLGDYHHIDFVSALAFFE